MNLQKYLYESLLDDEDELIKSNDDELYNKSILGDLSSDLYKDYNDYKIVKEPATVDGNTIIFPRDVKLNGDHYPDHKSISYYVPGIDTMIVKGTLTIHPVRNIDIIDNNYICKNIEAESIYFDLRRIKEINDINISINSPNMPGINNIRIYSIINGVKFKNIHINTKLPKINIWIETRKLPEFKNVTSNCDKIHLKVYNVDLTDNENELMSSINSLFDPKYKINVFDRNKSILINKKCNLKNIQAIINNPKKYTIESNLIGLKSGIKITDALGDIPKNIYRYDILNNNILISFEKGGDIIKNSSQKLSDEWVMKIMKR